MDIQKIPIKEDFKAYQILALCYHFYNQAMYVFDIIVEDGETYLIFKKISDLKKVNKKIFINGFKFEFKNKQVPEEVFYNIKQQYHAFETIFELTYNNIISTNLTRHNFTTKRFLISCELESKIYYTYNTDDFTRNDEFERYKKDQEDIVNKLKFYEEECSNIINIIKENKRSIYQYTKNYISIESIYFFNQYINIINNFKKDKKNIIDIINKLFDEDIQNNSYYKHGSIKFSKENNHNYITINKMKTYDTSLNSRISNIIIPIFNYYGSDYNKIKAKILTKRLLNE